MPVHNVHPTGVPNAQPADLLQFRGLLLDAELHVTDSLAQVLISQNMSVTTPRAGSCRYWRFDLLRMVCPTVKSASFRDTAAREAWKSAYDLFIGIATPNGKNIDMPSSNRVSPMLGAKYVQRGRRRRPSYKSIWEMPPVTSGLL